MNADAADARRADVLAGYTREFRRLVEDDSELFELLAGSDVTTDVSAVESLLAWEASRRFIASAVTRAGRVLDYGCANGFLLRCLREWCSAEIQPYGVDIDRMRLARARQLLDADSGRFTTPGNVSQMRVADGFDFVYWAVGDNVDFCRPDNIRWLQAVASLTSETGRLIIGFYGTVTENAHRIEVIERAGVQFSGTFANPHGPEMIAWLDQGPASPK